MIKVTEYQVNESNIIDVCFQIRDKEGCIPVYLDEFREWCLKHKCADGAFDIKHYSETDVVYTLKELDNEYHEYLLGEFLNELLGYESAIERDFKSERIERLTLERDKMIRSIELLCSTLSKTEPDESKSASGIMGIAWKVNAQWAVKEMKKLAENFKPKNA